MVNQKHEKILNRYLDIWGKNFLVKVYIFYIVFWVVLRKTILENGQFLVAEFGKILIAFFKKLDQLAPLYNSPYMLLVIKSYSCEFALFWCNMILHLRVSFWCDTTEI